MLTVSQIARLCRLSRTTLLYYESIGLMKPAQRTPVNYRRYTERDLQRLRQICVYREAGLKLSDIHKLLDQPGNDAAGILRSRLLELNREIERLRTHQRGILNLLQTKTSIWRTKVMTKEKWVSVMQAAGFTEADMNRWHSEFERAAPAEHEEFLSFLHIPQEEIRLIRERSRGQK